MPSEAATVVDRVRKKEGNGLGDKQLCFIPSSTTVNITIDDLNLALSSVFFNLGFYGRSPTLKVTFASLASFRKTTCARNATWLQVLSLCSCEQNCEHAPQRRKFEIEH